MEPLPGDAGTRSSTATSKPSPRSSEVNKKRGRRSTQCQLGITSLLEPLYLRNSPSNSKDLPKVRWVLPDSYLDVKNKDYGGEPFINGEDVPYDPNYHEE